MKRPTVCSHDLRDWFGWPAARRETPARTGGEIARHRRLLPSLLAFALAASLPPAIHAADPGNRLRLANSVKEISPNPSVSGPHLGRARLTAAEMAAPLDFMVSLRMRNYDEFQAIVQSGRTVAPAEMEARFLPLQADYDRLAAWLRAQGLVPTTTDARHTNLFVRGKISDIADALAVSFARVVTADGEFTSAVSAPALPEALAPAVLGVDGLQPHIRMQAAQPPPAPVAALATHPTRAIPADILAAYHVPSNLTGAGQTIAVFATALPLASDLATFNQVTGTNGNPAGFSVVMVNGGPGTGGSLNEVTLDTQWSSAVAPGANVRIYAAPTGSLTNFLAACTLILNEGVVKIVTSSISSPETSFTPAALQSASQLFAQMAAAGITVFHGSGDSGAYNSVSLPEYPTTDPYVTALSGTTMTFDANWNPTSETVWPNTGGGPSTFFARPAWQTGTGVPAGTMRCVPDAAAPASAISPTGLINPLVVLNGATNIGIGGTSLTGPIWAGLAALINQSRASAGLPSLGLLAPRLYPLLGTSAFNDIVAGSNGVYSATAGYDLCSGLGSPNVKALIQALTTFPSISTPPHSQSTATGGTVQFSVVAGDNPAPSYQWLHNGVPVSGATLATLSVNGATSTDAGVYAVAVTNGVSGATVTSDAAVLGIATSDKVIGAGAEIAHGIFVAANGNTFDQVLPSGPAVTVTAEPGKITRTSFVDLTNDIVQVEFSGAGTLSLVLDNPSGPALAANYNQSTVYMKGHAGIAIAGANETTNVSVFSVGRITAVNQALFKSDVTYDGLADLAFIAISSANGKFGSVRTANATYYATKGLTGLYAPGVQFTGPVYLGDINASDGATPVLLIGSSPDTRITGGDLLQANGQAVKVSGLTQLKFVAGSDSQGNLLSAKQNKAVLQQDGTDVTAQIVVTPSP